LFGVTMCIFAITSVEDVNIVRLKQAYI